MPEFLGLPGAGITNLAMRVVIPPLAGCRIGNRFAELMRAGGGQSVEKVPAIYGPSADEGKG